MHKEVTPLGKRLEEIRFLEKKNKSEFCQVIGFSSSSTYNLLIQGGKGLSINVLEAIMEKFKWINLHWFLTGEGNMRYESPQLPNATQVGESYIPYMTKTQNLSTDVVQLQAQVEIFKEKVSGLEQQVQAKDEVIKTKNELIDLLRKP